MYDPGVTLDLDQASWWTEGDCCVGAVGCGRIREGRGGGRKVGRPATAVAGGSPVDLQRVAVGAPRSQSRCWYSVPAFFSDGENRLSRPLAGIASSHGRTACQSLVAPAGTAACQSLVASESTSRRELRLRSPARAVGAGAFRS